MFTAVWSILLLIGALGLLAQLLLGGQVMHHGVHAHGAPHGAHEQLGHHGRVHSSASHRNESPERLSLLLSVFSPLTFFSFCVGAGATGLLLKHSHLASLSDIVCALCGGIVFYAAMVRPMTTTVLRFASTPSRALEGAVAQPAEVISRFDASGKGLVSLNVDGQIVRVLATLEDSDRPTATQIVPGDRLVVTSIDSHTNACKVARI